MNNNKAADKIKSIKQINSDLEYLKGEYDSYKLWGHCPDGDVKFENLLAWLVEHKYDVEHMIKVGTQLEEL